MRPDIHGWVASPEAPVLGPGEVHVWRVRLDCPASVVMQLTPILANEELARAGRFRSARDRSRFITSRGRLRLLLGRYLGLKCADVKLSYGPNGKPFLQAPAGNDAIYFNVTHSDALALFAVTRAGEVGADIERVRAVPEWKQIAARCFSADEARRLRTLPPALRWRAFHRLWTLKEALLKATGIGIAEFGPVADGIQSESVAEALGTIRQAADDPGMSVYPLIPAQGYAAALAVQGMDCRLVCLVWPEHAAAGFLEPRPLPAIA